MKRVLLFAALMATKKPVKKAAKKAAKKSASAKKPAAKKAAKPAPKPQASDRITVENVNVPGYKVSVDATKYTAMKGALLSILPKAAPGITQVEMMAATKTAAPRDVFPGGEKTEWWTKCVQLDLEAKGIVARTPGSPIRWRIK